MGEYRYDLATGGSRVGRRGLRGSTTGHGRQKQALPLAMVLGFWRLEQQDQRLKKQHGRWINIQRSLLLESFVD